VLSILLEGAAICNDVVTSHQLGIFAAIFTCWLDGDQSKNGN